MFLISGISIIAQVSISVDSTQPDQSAMLDVKSTSKGLLLPRVTHVRVDSIMNPANGLLLYCTDCGNAGGGALVMFISGAWCIFNPGCLLPRPPSSGIHVPTSIHITWNWNPVSYATGYKWNTTNNYATATNLAGVTTITETGLTCNTPYTRYVWAYSACGNSAVTTLNQSTLSCSFICGQAFTDTRDGKTYNTVLIGSQCWMKENLNIGTRISGSINQKNNDTIEKYCNNDLDANCAVYGGLYQWDELMNYSLASNSNPSGRQGICPVGWHVPSDVEWCQMETYLDASINCATTGWKGTNAGGKMKEVGTSHWANPNTGATNSSGFMCLPGGYRLPSGGFETLATGADFWTTSGSSSSNSWYRTLANNSALVYRNFGEKTYAFSGRCINDQ